MAGSKRPVVIGLEDSPEGRDALALGGALAAALGARPLLATAVALEGARGERELDPAAGAEPAPVLESARERLADLDPETRALASGSAAHALHDLAERESALAVVLGSTARGPLGRVLPGSTAVRLLHGSPSAVAVAARGLAHTDPLRLLHIAVAFDGSPESSVALQAGIGLAERCNAALAVFVVCEPVGFGAASTPAATPTVEQRTHHEREARRTLDHGLSRVPGDLPVTGRVLEGEAGGALVDVSADFDLIVVGSRAHGPLRRTLLGSTSRRLLNGAGCSVLALPRGVPAGDFTGQDS